MPRSRAFFGLAFALALVACDRESPLETVTAADDGLAAIIADGSGGGDPRSASGGSLFDRLAAEIPGFAGLYRSGPCAVTVVVTEAGDPEQAVRVTTVALAALTGRACPQGVRVHAERGQFTYTELQRWLDAARPLLAIDGVRSIRVDYTLNRLVITVSSHAAAARATEMLPSLGIPQEAVVFEGGGRDAGRDRRQG